MKKYLKWALLTCVVAFGAIQLTGAGRTNPAVAPGHDFLLSTNAPSPQVSAMLRSACYDCHSYETHWPWYGYVAPVSWWLAGHVRDARDRLNFSEWPHDDPKRAAKKLNHIADSIREGDMPLASYAKIHKAARLTEEQKKQLADWAEQESQRLTGTNAAQ